LMYGSNFCIVTLKPLACKSFARDAATIPLPNDDVTPPVTNMYLVISIDRQKGIVGNFRRSYEVTIILKSKEK
jgi:hypothetical protein